MIRYCFLDVRRVCEVDCMAFEGSDVDEPSCLLLNSIVRLEKVLTSPDTSTTYPVSAPPPEVT